MRWIRFPGDAQLQELDLGGKARALAALQRAALPIPDWFVIRGEACLHCLGQEGRARLAQASDPAVIQALLALVRPDPSLTAELEQALARICPAGASVAVRSSASDEDGAEHSFAGQLLSVLFVSPSQVPEKVAAVWRSGFTERVLAYRNHHGLPPIPRPPAVLVQRMITADAAGVAFSADPVSGRRATAVVSGVFGLGTALVSGEADADTWLVDRSGLRLQDRNSEPPTRTDPTSRGDYWSHAASTRRFSIRGR